MGVSIDIHRAHTADTLTTVVVVDNGLLVLGDELLVEYIDHLKKRSALRHILECIGLKVSLLAGTSLTPYLDFDIYIVIHCYDYLQGCLVLIVTLETLGEFVYQWLLVHDGVLTLALVLPAGDVSKVLIVTLCLTLLGLMLYAEVSTTALLTV